MAHSKVEKQVVNNATELDKLLVDDFKKKHNGKFVTFFNGSCLFSKSYGNALSKGNSKFGSEVGFVVRKITPAGQPVFSSLVKL